MSAGPYGVLLQRKGYLALLATQFLGALNDNLYRIIVSLYAVTIASTASGNGSYLALAGALFILPYLLFSGLAGSLADSYSKRSVLIVIKACEVGIMSLGLGALVSGSIAFMLVVLFLMATHSAFFSPAKYGILPEMFADHQLSRVNGLGEMCTFLAIILGTTLGAVAFDAWGDNLVYVGAFQVAVAAVGLTASLGIERTPRARADSKLASLPWNEVAKGFREVYTTRPLWFAVLGITYFWFLGSLLQLDIVLLGDEVMGLSETRIGLLQAALGVGIAIGSVVAGRLAGDRVELGLVPLGSIGMGFAGCAVVWATPSFPLVAATLLLVGVTGGFFIVPLVAFLQQRSSPERRGRLIATNNVLNMLGVLATSAVIYGAHDMAGVTADDLALAVSIATFVVTAYIIWLMPDALTRFLLYLLTHSLYRIRVVGPENAPTRGPALLVCNHVSFVDGLLVTAAIPRAVRFIVNRYFYELWPLSWFMRLMRAIPVSEGNPRDIIRSLAQARRELEAGHVVCIFAEGAITRTGNLLPFKRGFERIIAGLDVPIIPVHLDQVWGSIFSFKGRRFVWKWPERLPYPVTLSIGKALPSSARAFEVRQAIQELAADAAWHRRSSRDLLHLRFLRTAKRRWRSLAMADSTGARLSFGRLLAASLLLSRDLRRMRPDDRVVGVLLPASVAAAIANLAILFAGKVSSNLNFTTGEQALELAGSRSGLRTTLTSRTFLAKSKIPVNENHVFIEDLFGRVGTLRKLVAVVLCRLLPVPVLEAMMPRPPDGPTGTATILFSSGSTGDPKGVLLSHHAILSNVEAIAQVFQLDQRDRIMGVLPFFHAFGLTGTLWAPLICGLTAVYHANPLEAKTVGRMVSEHGATLMIATPTFCRAYVSGCAAEDFKSLRLAVVGAEKLQDDIAGRFREKFGVDLLEGYGATELGPVVAVNVPDVAHWSVRQTGVKPRTVGHPLPGVALKVVDPEMGQSLSEGQEGLVLVKSASCMLGYLDDPTRTAEVMRDGWYVTGDIGALDGDGFLRITDRMTRFSKVGGEMVPHLRIEEVAGATPGVHLCFATGISDVKRGERIVLLFTGSEAVSPRSVWEHLVASDLPRLWVPRNADVYRVEAIPILGTGKTDLRKARLMAHDLAEGRPPDTFEGASA
ncbi:MAG: acyl-[ACP]--phospholipid O-acyltransferase [Alphaproteobacteria bacterium]